LTVYSCSFPASSNIDLKTLLSIFLSNTTLPSFFSSFSFNKIRNNTTKHNTTDGTVSDQSRIDIKVESVDSSVDMTSSLLPPNLQITKLRAAGGVADNTNKYYQVLPLSSVTTSLFSSPLYYFIYSPSTLTPPPISSLLLSIPPSLPPQFLQSADIPVLSQQQVLHQNTRQQQVTGFEIIR
jgi:hypothetical protein